MNCCPNGSTKTLRQLSNVRSSLIKLLKMPPLQRFEPSKRMQYDDDSDRVLTFPD